MIKILVVEDEENIALALETIIKKGVPGSKVILAKNGIEALSVVNKNTLNLVVSDWNMPLMTGGELLEEVRSGDKNQDVPFLMLTARADAVSVRTAINAHVTEYIVKPFEKTSLLKKVIAALDDYTTEEEHPVSEESNESVFQTVMTLVKTRTAKGYLSFPVLSEIGLKAVDIINRRNNSLEELIQVIKPDQSISGKIMSVANSSFYRGQTPIETLELAVTRIGLKETGNIALAYSLRELFSSGKKSFRIRLKDLWEHSLITAIVAKQIGRHTGIINVERLYAAALFHDIGKLVLIPVLLELQSKRDDVTEDVIDKILDALHINLGVEVLKHWNFSNYFIEVVKRHHETDKVDEMEWDVQYVVLANQLSKIIADKPQDDGIESGLVSKVSMITELEKNEVRKILTESEDILTQMKMFFYT